MWLQNEWTAIAAHAEPVRMKMNVANQPNKVVYANCNTDWDIVRIMAPGWLRENS